MNDTIKIPNIVEPPYVNDRIDLERLKYDADYRRCALGRILEGDYTPEGLEAILTVMDEIRTQEIQLMVDESIAKRLRKQLLFIIETARSALRTHLGSPKE